MKHVTVIVWNDEKIIVNHLVLTEGQKRGYFDINAAIEATVYKLKKELGMHRDDMRWQHLDGAPVATEIRLETDNLI